MGTMAIMSVICLPMAISMGISIPLVAGAVFGGAIFGDHASPISDTTILSSAGAKCNHLRHVATQIPYATLVMITCFIGYIVAGFTGNPWISLALGAVIIVVAVITLHKLNFGVKKGETA